MVLQMNPATRDTAKYVLFVTLLVTAMNPLVIWRVLKADTGYWRGMGDRACALQGLFKQSHHMHEGVSSQGLHVLIELHRKHIIDFALLELRQQIGVGTTSTVFRGTLRAKTRVAVKVYQPSSFTEDIVAGFSHEAALCGLLHHPNIVTFYGMCVSPPAICLVFELCQGSLQDVMRVNARRPYEPARQQLLIDVGYMLDAARAVAYIHSFSPPFIHHDIKPENFLVDIDCCVKLADFGESRALGMFTDAERSAQRPSFAVTATAQASAVRIKRGLSKTRRPSTTATDDAYDDSTSPHDEVREEQWSASSMTVKGTADYMAPEVINGRGGVTCYDQAADVYSLAVTMWDILNPVTDRFADQSHLHVFEIVLNGGRPVLDPSLPPRLRDVIQRAWDGDARVRPSALAIVSVLEEIQESLSAAFVVDVMDELQLCIRAPDGSVSTGTSTSTDGRSHNSKFSGAAVADALVERQYVSSHVEATRMGNAWMDAGLLHHSKHARAFESSATAHYFFDVSANTKLQLALEAACRAEPASSIPMLSAIRHQGHHHHYHTHDTSAHRPRDSSFSVASVVLRVDDCACQQFARRMVDETAWRRFRRKPPGTRRATATDDMVLTTALLMDSDDDLDSFADRGCSLVRASHA